MYQAENFFLDAFESWRTKLNLEKMVLCGHSFGGYLNTVYSLRHPDRVEKLILASPVGVGKPPENPISALPHSDRLIVRLFLRAWTWNFTPQSFIRGAGPFGPRLSRYLVEKRFPTLPTDREALADYLYHISARPPSGEYSLNAILMPGAYARKPLCERLPSLQVPVTFICKNHVLLLLDGINSELVDGTHDWMDHRHAGLAMQSIKTRSRLVLIPESGHHMYCENAHGFNDVLLSELKSSASLEQTGDLQRGEEYGRGRPQDIQHMF